MIQEQTINNILCTALENGGDFAEVFVENKYNTVIAMSNTEVENGVVSRDYGVGIRVFFGHNMGYTYTSDDSEENLIKITKDVCNAFKHHQTLDFTPSSNMEKDIINARKFFSKQSYNDKTNVVKRAINAGMSYNDSMKRMFVRYLDQEQHVIIANTEGVFKEDNRLKTRMLISGYAEKNGVMGNGYIGPGAARGFEYYDNLDIEAYGKEAARAAYVMAGADYCPAGQMTVVVDNGFGGLMFHEACGHSLEASSVADGHSEFSNKIGEKVASDILTLIDDGSIENAWGSLRIDDEGTKTQKNVLIENGILKGYMIDKLNSRKMNMPITGSARRESYKYAPTSRMTNTYINAGKSTKDDIISNTEKGLFVQSINAGSVNPLTGEFNFSLSEAYLIKDGKLAQAVKGATLIGTGSEILKNIDMVGGNLSIGQGYCYAASGALFIGAGQPTVRISNMTVGGMKDDER